MAKSFDGQSGLTAQGESWYEITPSDDEDLPHVPKAIHCASETGGGFNAIGEDNVEAPFWINPGQVLPIRPKRILATDFAAGMTLTALRA
jgi:hypothetical protein